jgi:PAS domain S-box-containing protein
VEFRFRHKDGHWKCFESIGRTLSPTSPEEGILVNSRDITERKAAEEAVQRSEEHFRLLAENASDVITVLDSAGTILYESPAAERLFGYPSDEMVGRNAFEFFHPEDVAHAAAELTQVIRNPGTTRSAEFRFRHKDGRYIFCEAVGRTLGADPAAGIVVNTRDITERKRAEEELRFQKTLLEAQSEATIDGVPRRLRDGKIISTNRRFVDMWGIPHEVITTHSDEAALQAVQDKLLDPQEFLARVGYLYEHPDEESRDEIRLKDGRTFDRYSAPVKRADGAYYGRVWYFRDLTERKRAEEALRESEARSSAVIQHALDCVITINHTGRVVEFNPAAEATFGYTRAEALGQDLNDLIVPPAFREAHNRGIAHFLETGEGPVLNRRVEVPALRKDGTEIPVELAATAIPLTDPPLFTAYLRDITERKRAERELQSAKETAEEANRSKSEFLSRMSHELRTPMNSILGFAQLLGRKPLPADQRKSVDHILKAGRHLLDLINEVLDIARIEANRLQLSLEPVGVGSVLQEALSLYPTACRPTWLPHRGGGRPPLRCLRSGRPPAPSAGAAEPSLQRGKVQPARRHGLPVLRPGRGGGWGKVGDSGARHRDRHRSGGHGAALRPLREAGRGPVGYRGHRAGAGALAASGRGHGRRAHRGKCPRSGQHVRVSARARREPAGATGAEWPPRWSGGNAC